ncbi:MAG: homoprotocatechuate degradation operon regulator HpaR [Hyphomicrobiaceae bacterium]
MRPLDQSLPLKLLIAREAVMEYFRPHLNANDITEQQWRVIRALSEFGEIDIGTLSKRIAITMPSLSRMLPDLEKRSLIRRRRHQTDARTALVSLAPKGRVLFDAMRDHSETIYRDIQRIVGRQDLRALQAALNHLITALDSAREQKNDQARPPQDSPPQRA